MRLFIDRGFVLVLGVVIGCYIAFSFYDGDPILSVSSGSSIANQPPSQAVSSGADSNSDPKLHYNEVVDSLWVDPPADKCPTPLPAERAKKVAAGKKVVIAVLGDSFGDGVWAALYREFAKNPQYSVLQYSKVSTGITLNGDMNLEKRADEALSAHDVDMFVVVIGANDNQWLMHEGRAYQKLSAEWKEIYRQRIHSYLKHIGKNNSQIYWLGLPRMRSPKYDADINSINNLVESEMRLLRVPYLRTAPASIDAKGQYNQYFIDPKSGKRLLFRAKDGIHMSSAGYSHLAAPLIDRIKTCVASAKQPAYRSEGFAK